MKIVFSVKYIEEFEMELKIQLSNGVNTTFLEFYSRIDGFDDFANGLISFPKSINDVVIYELGENTESWAYYMLLKVYCIEKNGDSVIKIKIDNHKPSPDMNKVEFCIKAYPSSLNKLGQLLKSWNPRIENEIGWIAE